MLQLKRRLLSVIREVQLRTTQMLRVVEGHSNSARVAHVSPCHPSSARKDVKVAHREWAGSHVMRYATCRLMQQILITKTAQASAVSAHLHIDLKFAPAALGELEWLRIYRPDGHREARM